jgi:predicted NUDIX family NTP pyrophosphohydrolase
MQRSAGILLYCLEENAPRVLLAHPGGPYFAKKDLGAWTIPKGLIDRGEDPRDAARREFAEELGWRPIGELVDLGEVALRSGKHVIAFAVRSAVAEDVILARFNPGRFTMPWPPRSGKLAEFPEVDRIEFFPLAEAARRLNPAQAPLVDRLAALLAKTG